MTSDSAVTELIGALLIIAVIAGVLGIAVVFLISQPPPDQAPSVDFQLTCDPPQNGAK